MKRRWAVVLGLLAVVIGALAPPAVANHGRFVAPFPNGGLLWMSNRTNYSGSVWVEHNWIGCNAWERDRTAEVWNNVYASTYGQSYMGRWQTGVRMSNHGCNGFTLYNQWPTGACSQACDYYIFSQTSMDIGIGWDQDPSHFRQLNGNYIGGRNILVLGSPQWCAASSTSHPCGHRPWVQVNWSKWVGTNGFADPGDAYRRREILHETGHSHGLKDCPSINYGGIMMDDGTYGNVNCGWNNNLTGWVADDRQSVGTVYP